VEKGAVEEVLVVEATVCKRSRRAPLATDLQGTEHAIGK